MLVAVVLLGLVDSDRVEPVPLVLVAVAALVLVDSDRVEPVPVVALVLAAVAALAMVVQIRVNGIERIP